MIIIGHRGAKGLAPENTLASINKAIQFKTDIVEIDVRVTKDNIVILHHNSSVKMTSNPAIKIKDSSFKDIKVYKPDIVRLETVLSNFKNKTVFLIEVKPLEPTEVVVNVIKKAITSGINKDKILIGSKSQKTLVALHNSLPELKSVVIEPYSGVWAHIRANQVNTKILVMDQKWLWSGFIKAMSSNGYTIYAYTLNDLKKANKWRKYGLSGIVTDYPDIFAAS